MEHLKKEGSVDEIFGSKPGYQKDIEDREIALSKGYESTYDMLKDETELNQALKQCSFLSDGMRFFADKVGVKLPTGFLGFGLKVKNRSDADKFYDVFAKAEKQYPKEWPKFVESIRTECKDSVIFKESKNRTGSKCKSCGKFNPRG